MDFRTSLNEVSISNDEFDEETPLVHDIEKESEDHYSLGPEASLYSYHLFVTPMDARRSQRQFTWSMCFTVTLLFLNFAMQYGLLTVVTKTVFDRHADQLETIIVTDNHPWYSVHKWFQSGIHDDCHDASSGMCQQDGDRFACAPPTIRLLRSWDALDLDGDGVWTRAEAENKQYRARMRCEYGADTLVVYERLLSALREQSSLASRLHPDLTSGFAVHRPYLDWYLGEPMLCQYGSKDMCGNIFFAGVFDEAIKTGGNLSSGIHDLQSARTYCEELLGHRCKTLMPASWQVWKAKSSPVCGAKHFTNFVYNSPDKDPDNWMTYTHFERPEEFAKYKSPKMLVFLCVLLISFFTVMYVEWKSIYRVYLFILHNPKIHDEESPFHHRCNVLIINILRTVLFVFLLYVGIIFLTSSTSYMGMIFDALSLVFIIEIDELLYEVAMRGPMIHDHFSIHSVNVPRKAPGFMRVMALETLVLAAIVFTAFAVTYSYMVDELKPVHEALNCLCSVEGASCSEAAQFGKAWWAEYWSTTLPQSSLKIDKLVAAASAS